MRPPSVFPVRRHATALLFFATVCFLMITVRQVKLFRQEESDAILMQQQQHEARATTGQQHHRSAAVYDRSASSSDLSPHAMSVDQEASCIKKKKDVLLVGNRPVGTYLCSYFPNAHSIPGGCALLCHDSQMGPFTCSILAMGSHSQLRSADIVVNHHGPVPKKFSPLEPVLTVFYSGESNASEGKKSLHTYQMQYDVPVSFHTHRPLYFTWTHRFEAEFAAVLSGSLQKSWPPWDRRRNAVAIFVSRCKKGLREQVIQGLGKYYPVHSFGKCHRTHHIDSEFPMCAALSGGRYPQKLCVFQQYKYILALDNTRELDYVTEKVYHALIAGAVPIYDGAPNADRYLPGGWSSVIRLSSFQEGSNINYERLAAKLTRLEVPSVGAEGEKEDLHRWTKAVSENEWGNGFVDALHHEEPTCSLCNMARHKRCRGG